MSLGCSDLDSLWERATQPYDAAATAVEAIALPVDPNRAPRADEDAGGSALEPDPEDAGAPEAYDAGEAAPWTCTTPGER